VAAIIMASTATDINTFFIIVKFKYTYTL